MNPAPRPAASAAGTTAEDPRSRLLHAGLRLFANQGFSKTSTRELAEAAGVNVAAISYYFGDKAGLYRATFLEPMGAPEEDLARFIGPELSLAQALRGFFAGFLEPLRHGDTARLCMKLHFREMLESTGLWETGVNEGIKPMHDGIVAVLCRHFGLAQADDELRRLAVCLAGLGVHMHVGRDITEQLVPGLTSAPDAIDRWADTLLQAGLAMVQAEAQRRGITLKVTDPT
jgi:TetR/AcrR family transcriptional regulator, regulator of cefoperazone and chloramphenicol sensitivity